jgi:SHS2 domain-containing protein
VRSNPQHTLACPEPTQTSEWEAAGHDLHSALYAFLDEALFAMAGDMLVLNRVRVAPIDRVGWRVKATG